MCTWHYYPSAGGHEHQPLGSLHFADLCTKRSGKPSPQEKMEKVKNFLCTTQSIQKQTIPRKKEIQYDYVWVSEREKRRELGYSQSSSDIIEKLLSILKEKRDHFNNKIWVALILKLLKLQKLIIQDPLLSPNKNKAEKPRHSKKKKKKTTTTTTTTTITTTTPSDSDITETKQNRRRIAYILIIHFLGFTSINKDLVYSINRLCIWPTSMFSVCSSLHRQKTKPLSTSKGCDPIKLKACVLNFADLEVLILLQNQRPINA